MDTIKFHEIGDKEILNSISKDNITFCGYDDENDLFILQFQNNSGNRQELMIDFNEASSVFISEPFK